MVPTLNPDFEYLPAAISADPGEKALKHALIGAVLEHLCPVRDIRRDVVLADPAHRPVPGSTATARGADRRLRAV